MRIEKMKDSFDDRTIDLITPQPKKRGRRSTGFAMTPAQKQAAYRARKAADSVTVTFKREDINTLKRAINNPDPSLNLDKSTLERLTETLFQACESQALK
jgi:hypothetical protein